jgi:hypothetical protein
MLFSYVALATSTLLPTAGTLLVLESGLRSPLLYKMRGLVFLIRSLFRYRLRVHPRWRRPP